MGYHLGSQADMNKTLAVLLVATLVGIYAVTEIQELGNANQDAVKATAVESADDAESDDLGEGVGRRGAFLSTTGSFTLSSGSNAAGNDEEDDELGEGVGRRGAFLSTTGSFTLSSGSNAAGNDEEDEM